MKGFLALVLVGGLLLTGCSGLPTSREMGDMALLRTMGVDAVAQGVEVTGSTGPRAKGLQAEGEGALVLSAQGESLSAACLAMQSLSDNYVFFGYVDQLLLGEETAQRGMIPVLDYYARDVELGLGAQLWLVRGETAKKAVESGGETGVEGRLSTLQTDGKLGVAAISRTAGEVYADLMELGSAFVPAVMPGEEENTSLIEAGYGVLKDGRLLGYLEGETARGLEILKGRAPAEVLTTELEGEQVSARIISASTVPGLLLRDGVPVGIELNCLVEVELTEYNRPLEERTRQVYTDLLEKRLLKRMEETLTKLQFWQTDCVGLGIRAAFTRPEVWQRVEDVWPECFSELEREINLNVTVHE